MVSIRVTQEIKDANPDLNLVLASVFVQEKIPSFFNGFEGYNYMTDLHAFDGWVTFYPNPEYDRTTQKIDRSQIIDIMDGETLVGHTYLVVDKTDEELETALINQSESNRQQLIQQKLEADALASYEAEEDDEILLENMDAFEFWQPDTWYTLSRKVKRVVNLELKLYKVNQPHTSQSIYPPEAEGVEALYSEIAPPGVIPDWVQPTGAHNAYALGAEVKHNGFYWTSKIPANTTEPTDANWQWWEKGDPV